MSEVRAIQRSRFETLSGHERSCILSGHHRRLSWYEVGGHGRAISRYSTEALVEDPITPPVDIKYTKLLINGQHVDSASGKTFPTFDPRTGEVITHVAKGDAEDINRAVASTRRAFDEGPWPRMTAYERSKILFKFADLVEKHIEELAYLETRDNGKPYKQALRSELPLCVRIIRYYAGT